MPRKKSSKQKEMIPNEPQDVTNPEADSQSEEDFQYLTKEEEPPVADDPQEETIEEEGKDREGGEDSEDADPEEEEEGTGGDADADSEEDSDDGGEFEVVLEDDADLSDKQIKTQKYHDRMNERKAEAEKAKESEADAARQLGDIQKENAYLKQLLQQSQQGIANSPPDPENREKYPDGTYDSKYIADLNEYHANRATLKAQETLLKVRQQEEKQRKADERKRDIERAYEKHYQRATELDKKLKKKNYDEMEKVTMKILGDDLADFITENFDHSELIFYKLGTDSDKARYFKDLMERKPGRGVKELAVFESKIKKVRRKPNKAPDPESRKHGGYKKTAMKGDGFTIVNK